eukprot:2609555-Pyramimonas_sp.AAC.1
MEDQQQAFFKKLTEEQPDEVHLSPRRGPWSNVQGLNIHRHPGWKEHPAELRDWHHRVHPPFGAKVYR